MLFLLNLRYKIYGQRITPNLKKEKEMIEAKSKMSSIFNTEPIAVGKLGFYAGTGAFVSTVVGQFIYKGIEKIYHTYKSKKQEKKKSKA